MLVNYVMDVGYDFIFLLNNNTNMFCKDNINNMANDLLEGYNMLLNINTMVPGDRTLLAIVKKFNLWKFLSFITKEVKRIIKYDNIYLSK